MKNFILMLILAIAAIGFIGCGEDDKTKADLKWKNNEGSSVSEIQWINSSTASVDQTWSGTTANGSETEFKGIKSLAGTGECVSGGVGAKISFDTTNSTGVSSISSNSAVVTENASAMLIISGTTPVKK